MAPSSAAEPDVLGDDGHADSANPGVDSVAISTSACSTKCLRGRTPIVTRRLADDRSDEVWKFVRKQVEAKHQAYIVYPVIEENEETELKAALKMYKELDKKVFPDLRVALLHGRMPADLKEQVMRMFQKGDIDILVATTVIEVGVDVANASVMVIEHAERFGLSQLHQLRGRIGRGAASRIAF